MYKHKTISLSKLLLDEENYRIGEQTSQRDCIIAILEEQALKGGKNKILNLAKHIAENGLSPIEPIVVIRDHDNPELFVVKEGNRRITAMKLLANPNLVPSEMLRNAFIAASEGAEVDFDIECWLFDDADEADKWIEPRHSTQMSGVGLEKWGSVAQERSEEAKGRIRRTRAVLDFLKSQAVDIAPYEEGRKGITTAVDRVLNSGAMRVILGVYVKNDGTVTFENGDYIAGTRLLCALMDDMTGGEFKTADVHSLQQREAWIRKFAHMAVKDGTAYPANPNGGSSPATAGGGNPGLPSAPGAGGSGTSVGGPSMPAPSSGTVEGAAAPTPAAAPGSTGGNPTDPLDRKTLPRTKPKSERYVIRHDDRLRRLYNELVALQVDGNESISAAMIRVFLDLSVVHYLLHKGIPHPKPEKSWDDYDVKLRNRVERVLDDLDPKKASSKLNEIRKGFGDKGWMHSIENLHNYLHSLGADPSAREIKQIWDRYHPMFKSMFVKLNQ